MLTDSLTPDFESFFRNKYDNELHSMSNAEVQEGGLLPPGRDQDRLRVGERRRQRGIAHWLYVLCIHRVRGSIFGWENAVAKEVAHWLRVLLTGLGFDSFR
jgi:hypothetical protein